MIDGQGVVSHQRDRRSRGCSRPDAGRLPVICSDRLSRNYDQSPNVQEHSQPPKPGLQGARDRRQRVREPVVPPRSVVHGPVWRGGDRLGGRRAWAQGARPSAVDTCDMPSSDAEKSPRIPCLYTICHALRFRHARTRLFPGRGWSKGTRAGRRSFVAKNSAKARSVLEPKFDYAPITPTPTRDAQRARARPHPHPPPNCRRSPTSNEGPGKGMLRQLPADQLTSC
jgi:hypothetical protein